MPRSGNVLIMPCAVIIINDDIDISETSNSA